MNALEELTTAMQAYEKTWADFVAKRTGKEFFQALKSTAAAWKTTDLADFESRFAELKPLCDHVHLGWVNERWLATLHLKDSTLPGGVTLIKLMQRRPGSQDPTGLDHYDFYIPPKSSAKEEVQKEDIKWTEEKNGEHCRWISIWFANTEAKLRSDTVLEVCADELMDVQKVLEEVY